MSKIKKKELITIIQDTECFSEPKVELEQYCTDAVSTVDIVFFAGVEFNDITNKVIFDLGAGTGRLSLACAFLRPKKIFSVEIDQKALRILKLNVQKLEISTPLHPCCADVEFLPFLIKTRNFELPITTIMNPPVGVQTRRADRVFLERAFSFSNVIYSVHLSGKENQNFIKRFIAKFGWKIDYSFPYFLSIEQAFEFHEMKTKKIYVDIYRFIKSKL